MKFKLLTLSSLVVIALAFSTYLLTPNSEFPAPPPDAFRSVEPADSEIDLRRAYFTNFTRQQVISHYKKQFKGLVTLNLNYPPEDSQTLIRDQTMSTYLEELVHPFRESIYINGFKPTKAKDDIWYKGVHYEQKIIIKYAGTSPIFRLIIMLSSLLVLFAVIREWLKEFKLL